MRVLSKAILALGLIGAAGAPSAMAQGVYFEGPGFGVGVGTPYHYRHYRYYDDDRPYVRVRPYAEYRYHRYRQRYWDD
jgi:hypothetical protein